LKRERRCSLLTPWSFTSIQFVMTEASRRPAMAFVFFTGTDGGKAPGTGEGTVV